MAWDTITQPAALGGLDITSFHDHATLLKLQCVSQLIMGAKRAWVEMAGILIKDSLWSSTHKNERRVWTSSEALLFQVDIHTASRIVNHILRSWKIVGGKLQFDQSCDTIPPQLIVVQMLELMEAVGEGVRQDWAGIIAYSWVRRIFVATDLWNGERWLTVDEIHGQFCENQFSSTLTLQLVLEFLVRAEGLATDGKVLS